MEITEECPVCWRTFGPEVVPVVVNCGHTFCESCSEIIKTCALCRKKVTSRTKATNYSLISLIDKIGQKPLLNEVSTQTDGLEQFRTFQSIEELTSPLNEFTFFPPPETVTSRPDPDLSQPQTVTPISFPRNKPQTSQSQQRKYPVSNKKAEPVITLQDNPSGSRTITLSFK